MSKQVWLVVLVVLLVSMVGCVAAPPAPSTGDTAPAAEEEPAAEETGSEEAEEVESASEEMAEADQKFVIGMMTIVSHPSLDAIQQGAKDALAEAGFVDGENIEIIEGNAEGDMATLSTIAQQFVDESVDLIVATTTPAPTCRRPLLRPILLFSGNPFPDRQPRAQRKP